MVVTVPTPSSFRATPHSAVGLRDRSGPTAGKQLVSTDLRREWSHFLTSQAPPGINASQHNNIGDAWRHYATAAFLTAVVRTEDWPIPTSALKAIFDLTEDAPGNPPEEKVMDQNNNRAGADSPGDLMVRDYFTQKALDFMADVGRGRVKVIDPVTGHARNTTPDDIPHVTWSDIDKSYTHPTTGGRPDDNTLVA